MGLTGSWVVLSLEAFTILRVHPPYREQTLGEGQTHRFIHPHLDHAFGQPFERGTKCDCTDGVYTGRFSCYGSQHPTSSVEGDALRAFPL